VGVGKMEALKKWEEVKGRNEGRGEIPLLSDCQLAECSMFVVSRRRLVYVNIVVAVRESVAYCRQNRLREYFCGGEEKVWHLVAV
jgi:hypothetical protein